MKALCLWDPVDVTVYAPQSAEYPSAVAALRNVQSNMPVAIVGGGKAGDCVPKNSNYRCLHPMLLYLRPNPSNQLSHGMLLFIISCGFAMPACLLLHVQRLFLVGAADKVRQEHALVWGTLRKRALSVKGW